MLKQAILVLSLFHISCARNTDQVSSLAQIDTSDVHNFRCTKTSEETTAWLNQPRFKEARKHILETSLGEKDSDRALKSEELLKVKSVPFGQAAFTDEDVKYLCNLTELTSLSIYNDNRIAQLTGKTLHHLSTLTQLEDLDLDFNDIRATELWRLKNLKKVKLLKIQDNHHLSDEGLENLNFLPSLQEVVLKSTNLNPSSYESFAKLSNHPALHSVFLGCNAIDDHFLPILAKFKNLHTVNLEGNRLTFSKLESLQSLSLLKTLDLSGPGDCALKNEVTKNLENLASLEKFPSLEDISLHDLDIDQQSVDKYLSPLKNQLKVVGLAYKNKVTAEMLQNLASYPKVTRIKVSQEFCKNNAALIQKIQGSKEGLVIIPWPFIFN